MDMNAVEETRRSLTLIDDDIYAYREDNYDWGDGKMKKDDEHAVNDFHNMKINDVAASNKVIYC